MRGHGGEGSPGPHLCDQAGEGGDEVLLVRRDVEGGRQLGHTQQVLGQGAAQRQNPGVETCLSWRKDRGREGEGGRDREGVVEREK